MIRDFEAFTENRAGFILNQQEAPMGLVFCDLLHNMEVVYSRKEVAERVCRNWFFGERTGRVS